MTTHLIRFTDGIATDASGRQYRLVPVEPTSAMLVDAVKERHGQATYRSVSASGCVTFEQEARADYEAMLSAATVDLAGMAVKVPNKYVVTENTTDQRKIGYNQAIDALGVK